MSSCHQRGFLNNKWEQVQRLTVRHCRERERERERISIRSFLLEIREPLGEREGKIVGVRGDVGYQENMAHQINKPNSHRITY